VNACGALAYASSFQGARHLRWIASPPLITNHAAREIGAHANASFDVCDTKWALSGEYGLIRKYFNVVFAASAVLSSITAIASEPTDVDKYTEFCPNSPAFIRSPVDRSFSDPVEAAALLTTCLDKGPTVPLLKALLYIVRSEALAQVHDSVGAAADLEHSFELQPPDVYSQYLMLSIYYRQSGEFEKALKPLRQLIANKSMMARAQSAGHGVKVHFLIGLNLGNLGQWREAVRAYTEALQYQPDFVWAYIRRAEAYHALGLDGIARTDIFKAIQLSSAATMSVADRIAVLGVLTTPPFVRLRIPNFGSLGPLIPPSSASAPR
jgi:tetratricopeptide (TPR) repeat protein